MIVVVVPSGVAPNLLQGLRRASVNLLELSSQIPEALAGGRLVLDGLNGLQTGVERPGLTSMNFQAPCSVAAVAGRVNARGSPARLGLTRQRLHWERQTVRTSVRLQHTAAQHEYHHVSCQYDQREAHSSPVASDVAAGIRGYLRIADHQHSCPGVDMSVCLHQRRPCIAYSAQP